MDSTIIKVITEALENYEKELNRKIDILENKILRYEREREAIINNLRDGNIELLKRYFNI